ncbi:MAG: hypothetical protein B0D92_02485 [Spirochaeta sp. LUC14_002_19_P3]|nr:MAG: hypothetical protein B0D92_02485 [Spirochaeta sp. LUC14_002_19_P3]
MRPRTMDEFVGQEHIVGPGRLLRRAIAADQISSLIFYGPPGTGKTTLAQVIAGSTKSRFAPLNAVLAAVADIRREIAAARDAHTLHGRRTILFVDEVHRWNKSQQDALLPWVENGTVILIGATTENPYFTVNKALVSRSRIFQLTGLDEAHLFAIAHQVLSDTKRGYGRWKVEFEPGALDHLVSVSSGDARSLLNALELAVETTPEAFPPPEGEHIVISLQIAEESIQRKAVLYDREGDYHFDTISAFIKSIRGSDPDAALYWLALMVRAGEDPRFIFRRMLVSACEDIGQAAPEALGVVQNCAEAFDRVGLPEGQYLLAHACLYLSTAPKSNSVLGYFDALKTVDEEANSRVPSHLQDASRDKQAFGHGEGYKYPHAWREHWTAQQYLPASLAGRVFYRPGELGHEGSIRETLLQRRKLQVAAMLEDDQSPPGEILTYSPGDSERERWVRRLERNLDSPVSRVRQILFDSWRPLRHQRVLIPADSGGLLLWEAHRLVPEGGVTALVPSPKQQAALGWLAEGLPASERPRIILGSLNDAETLASLSAEETRFDVLLARNCLLRHSADTRLQLLRAVHTLAARFHLAEGVPGGTRIGQLVPSGSLGGSEQLFREAEESIYRDMDIDTDALANLIEKGGWKRPEIRRHEITEQRGLTSQLLDRWFFSNGENGYRQRMELALGEAEWRELALKLKELLGGKTIAWTSCFWIISSVKNE